MSSKTQADVVETFDKPSALREWDVPTPGTGQILVKTEACGVRHTDLHAARGDNKNRGHVSQSLPDPTHSTIHRCLHSLTTREQLSLNS
jgi:threonine dehydrogenase-like Zn-dependent dehydrogenase